MQPLDSMGLKIAQDRRKAHIREREYWLAEQKRCGREQRELARYASDQAKEYLQWERAATWVISFTQGTAPAYAQGGSQPGSWKVQSMPIELSSMIRNEFHFAEFGITADYKYPDAGNAGNAGDK